jgi:hypothetical protein
MDKEKIKLIVHNMELLIDSLKNEILLENDHDHDHDHEHHNSNLINDYDEIYEELD